MPRIEKKLNEAGAIYWVDHQEKRHYKGVVGAMAWPGADPGFIVVLGSDVADDPVLMARPIYLLAEAEEPTVDALVRRALDFQKELEPDTWHGDMDNRPALELFLQTTHKPGRPPLNLMRPPGGREPDSFRFCINTLLPLLAPERKLLFFGDRSRLPTYLSAAPTDLMAGSASQFPPIAALAFGVAALSIWGETKTDELPRRAVPHRIF